AAGATPDGYAALPADVEAAAAAAGAEQGRTWTMLFLDACKYAWPQAPMLQVRVLLCVLLLVVMRVLNLAVPITYKKLVDNLAEATAAPQGQKPSFSGWELLYLAAIFFQGGAGGGITGFVNNARQWLWIPVSQDAYRRVSLVVFGHVLDLDLSFHLSRKTGEVTKVVDRGTAAIQNIVDMVAAATYLAGALEPWVALIVFVTIGSYIPLTIIVTEWRGNFRRDMNKTDNARSARVTDALLNWETVKYFTNEQLEQQKYGEAIDGYQSAEYRFLSSLNVLNVVQSLIMFVGISAGVLACTAGVSRLCSNEDRGVRSWCWQTC
ncbi:ABC transporter type 1, transmembrane domain-containing protein, partial [Scenedesmus sp. NREL 46B-D3]